MGSCVSAPIMDKTPQLENGFMRLATEITQQLQKTHLSGNEWQILWVVLCKTYGWNKKEDLISLTQFQKETMLERPRVIESLKTLVRKSVLMVSKDGRINSYKFNKNYTEWSTEKVVRKSVPSTEKRTPLVRKSVLKVVRKSVHTIDKKDTNTKDIKEYKEKDFSSVEKLTSEDLKEIANDYGITYSKVAYVFEQLKLYDKKVYKNYKLALKKWIVRDLGVDGLAKARLEKNKPKTEIPETLLTDKQRAFNLDKLRQLKIQHGLINDSTTTQSNK